MEGFTEAISKEVKPEVSRPSGPSLSSPSVHRLFLSP